MNFKSFMYIMIGIAMLGISTGYTLGFYVQKQSLNNYWFYFSVPVFILASFFVVFGTLFNDIIVQRKDNAGNIVQDIKVPLAYAPREKALARINADPDLARKVCMVLPRMSFEMQSFNYAPERKLNKIHRNVSALADDKAKLYAAYNPVAYDIGFDLNIYTR